MHQQTLSLLFDKEGKSSWYDNDELDKSEKAMEEGVKHSNALAGTPQTLWRTIVA